ncbi:MAG: peptidyl-prolyl cis-trans isomerase [Chitinophagaceae bacterium]|nr:peptidyl-prolyl cis-trans isomerase [Chitinophagaceae bacterium]
MNKQIHLALVAGFFAIGASAQTLFTYGKHKVASADFLRAYNKNNLKPGPDKAKAISEYLDLYIKSRLKVAEAYEKKFDTLPQIKTDVKNLRTQIAENYMTDPGMMQHLTKEAFDRSQKDVHFAHIYISFRNAAGFVDTVAANKKRDEVRQRLGKGEDFLLVAQELSDDPLVKTNKGDAGFITVFTLPYEFESAVYNTPVGQYSDPVRSKTGFHIFKKIEERKAAGKMKAQQILLATPPGASDPVKKQLAAKADSEEIL